MSRTAKTRVETALIAGLLLAGAATAAYGLVREDWPQVWAVIRSSLSSGYLYFLAACTALIAIAASTTRLGHTAITLLLGAAITLLAGALWPLLAVAIFLCAASSLGHLALGVIGRWYPAPGEVDRILVGTGLYATLVGVMVHFPVNRPWVYFVMLAIPIVLARRHLWDAMRTASRRLAVRDKTSTGLLRPLLGSLALMYLAVALLPELAHDALAMHLFVPSQVAANQAWDFDPARYVWTFMPMLANWCYTIGWMLAGETAVRLINLAFVLIGVHLVREFVLMLDGCRRGADWAALILLSTPLTFLVASSVFVEAFWSAYLLAGTVWMFRAIRAREASPVGFVPSGLLLGFAAASKAIALLYVPFLAVPALAQISLLRSRAFWLSLAVASAAFLVVVIWPYAVAYMETGNPVFPFYNSLFQSQFYPVEDFSQPTFTAKLSWDLFYQIVFSAEQFIEGRLGAAGFQWLILAAPTIAAILLCQARRATLLLVFGALALLAVFSFQTYLRYIYPIFLILSVLAGFAFSAIARRHDNLRKGTTIAIGLTLLLNILFLGSASVPYRDVPVLDSLRDGGVDDLVNRRAPVRQAVELVNVVNGLRFPVAFLSAPLAGGLEAPALFQNWYNQSFAGEVRAATDLASFTQALRRHRGRYLIVDPFWKDKTGRIAGFAAATGDLLGRFGHLAVYRLKDEWFYNEELIQASSRFDAKIWAHRASVELTEVDTAVVSGRGSVVQGVRVVPGEFYRNSVVARCLDEPGLGRVQITWRHPDGSATSDIKVFPCSTEWSRKIQETVAPAGVVHAGVYGTSHDGTPLEIAEVSLRRADD